MSVKVYVTTKKWVCPHCQTVVKWKSECDFLYLIYLVFLPIVLIVLLLKAIVDYFTKDSKLRTKTGDDVVFCSGCGKHLVLSEVYGRNTKTRIAVSKENMIKAIEPVLAIIKKENIAVEIIKTERVIFEYIKVKFTNGYNGRTLLTEIYISGSDFIVIANGEEMTYSHKSYLLLVMKELDYRKSEAGQYDRAQERNRYGGVAFKPVNGYKEILGQDDFDDAPEDYSPASGRWGYSVTKRGLANGVTDGGGYIEDKKTYSENELCRQFNTVYTRLTMNNGGKRSISSLRGDEAVDFLRRVCRQMPYSVAGITFDSVGGVEGVEIGDACTLVFSFARGGVRACDISSLYLVNTLDDTLRMFTVECDLDAPLLVEYNGVGVENHGYVYDKDDELAMIEKLLKKG